MRNTLLTCALVLVLREPPAAADVGTRHHGALVIAAELETDELRVTRLTLPAHGTTPMHDITPRLAIWLSDGDLKITYADGRTEVQRLKKGTVRWIAMPRHAGENLGDQPIEWLTVELKTTR